MITFDFFGQSHGKCYGGVIRGLPNGFTFDVSAVNQQLYLRKCGYGRSNRQSYADVVTFDGFSDTVTVDGDLHFTVGNVDTATRTEITALRSGHADVVGTIRYPDMSVRQIAEIASARNSICYVVLGAICKLLLARNNIFTYHHVDSIGNVSAVTSFKYGITEKLPYYQILNCADIKATRKMCKLIDKARSKGNSLGGVVTVGATGVPIGIGNIVPYYKRLDAVISANLVGIPSVKGITFGNGNATRLDGVTYHDKLTLVNDQIQYATNNCGGIVSGITTGQDIVCHLAVKPVPTVKGVTTIDAVTHQEVTQQYERADTCVVPNVGVIAENILAYVLYNEIIDTEQNKQK